ncbi:MAG: phospholipid carrier-dependent glycosyltransferase [Chloroflexia bacterium]
MDQPPAELAAPAGSAPCTDAASRRPVEGRRATRVMRQSLALFLAFLGFYLLTASGHFYTVDEETLYLMTERLVEHGDLALSADNWGIVGDWGLTVAQGSTSEPVYAIFSPGQPIAAVPLYLVGKGVAAFFPANEAGYVTRFFVSLFGAFATAATVALLYRFARHLGYGGGAALGLAAIYGLATTAWPHGRTFLAEPLTALCLLTACYGIRRGTEAGPHRAWLAFSGAAAVAAVVTKPHALIAVALLGPYLLWRAAAPGRAAGRWRLALRGVVRACAIWGGGAGVVAGAYLLFNLAMYGTLLRSGYGDWPLALFNYPLLKGLYGLTLSSGKGIVWYAPPVVLATVALRPFWRRHPAEAALCVAIALAHLLFYGRLRFWHGDWIWGPRFLLIALPFAMLPLAALLEGLRVRRWRLAAVATVVVAGLGVQLLGTSVNFAWYIARETDQEARWFAPSASPILAHARQARARVALWAAQFAHQPDTVVLTTGFAGGEEGDDAIFPRWTTGSGTIARCARPGARR